VSIAGDLRDQGWCLTSAVMLGWPGPQAVLEAFSPALVPDPRGPGKLHARDVLAYDGTSLSEAGSIAFTTEAGAVVDDFSRFRLLGPAFGAHVAGTVLALGGTEPAALSADYFRYSDGAESAAHRDGFASYVVIWVLGRFGAGGESFLIQHGREVLTRALQPGEVLIFRDELFLHGARAMRGTGAWRDVLILSIVRP
jgi:2-oxoglutarate-Fe(II)-dependent dioxygenase family protein